MNTLLMNLVGQTGWDAIVQARGAVGTAVAVLLGVGIGRMRDLQDRSTSITTTTQFIERLRASRLVNENVLQSARMYAFETERLADLADRLIRDGLVTRWQVDQLLLDSPSFMLGSKYRLIDRLGEGAVGTVFRAEQIATGRTVAIKMLVASLAEDEQAKRRFLREVQAVGALQHPNIVHALDADMIEGQLFLVMEYVDARDLEYWLKHHSPLPVDWACECIRQASRGLQKANESGLVHRDIKPANLLVISKGVRSIPHLKILDLGLARFIAQTEGTKLTQTDLIMGTPDYIAPEQAESMSSADTRADVFSLGVTLFELLTESVPWSGETSVEKLVARFRHDAPRARSRRQEIDPRLDDIIARMLARSVNDRPQSQEEVAAMLAPFSMSTSS